MHAACCGIHDDVYRVLVDWRSAGRDDIVPCAPCARRAAPATTRNQAQSQSQSTSQSQSRRRSRSSDAGQSQSQSTSQSQSQSRRRNRSSDARQSQSQSQSTSQSQLPVRFIKVARGCMRLCFNGFSYTKKAEKKNRIRWECSQRKTHACKGAVTTSLSVTIFSY